MSWDGFEKALLAPSIDSLNSWAEHFFYTFIAAALVWFFLVVIWLFVYPGKNMEVNPRVALCKLWADLICVSVIIGLCVWICLTMRVTYIIDLLAYAIVLVIGFIHFIAISLEYGSYVRQLKVLKS